MKKFICICLAALAAFTIMPRSANAAAQNVDENLQAYIQGQFENTHIPGMSVQIVDANNVLFEETYGNC